MQKFIVLFLFIVLTPILLFAQYEGGSYDGYAQGEGETEVFTQFDGGSYDGFAQNEGETEVFDSFAGGSYDGSAYGEGETEVFDSFAGGSADGYAQGETDGGQTLPTCLSTFTAQFIENTPTLYWKTESEIDNLGWLVYRNNEQDFSTSEQISDFIEGYGTTTQQHIYVFEDRIQNPEIGSTYYYWLESIDFSGIVTRYENVAQLTIPDNFDPEIPNIVPTSYGIKFGPNPFRTNLVISYMLPQTDLVRIEIYNVMGQLIAQSNEGVRTADKVYIYEWDSKDMMNRSLSSGVILIKLMTSDKTYTQKAILLD